MKRSRMVASKPESLFLKIFIKMFKAQVGQMLD